MINKIILFSIIGGVLILVLVLFAVPFPYTAVEEYSEKEPYTAIERYSEKEPYTTTECDESFLTKNVKWGSTYSSCIATSCDYYNTVCIKKNWLGNCLEYEQVCQSYSCEEYKAHCSLIIRNLDNKGGIFSFNGYYVTDDNKKHFVKSISTYLQPGDEKTLTWNYEYDAGDSGNCRYENFETPTKTECENVIKTRTVSKTREVTRYKEVSKTRDVSKYATLFQWMIGDAKWYYLIE